MAFKYRSSHRSKFNRILSKGRIFSRKSKRAQASQIWALKKTLSSYIRRTRPETIIQNFQSSTTIAPVGETSGGSIGSITWLYPDGTTGTSINPPNFQGDFCRLYNLLVEGVFRFTDTLTGGQPIALRLLVVQTTRSRAQGVATEDLFRRSNQTTQTSSSYGNALAVHGPLQTGASSIGRILWDRRYTLQPNKTSNIHVSFNLRRLTNFRVDSHGLADGGGSSEGVPQGRIYVFYAYSYPSTDETPQQAELILNAKLAYPDN